ncbi:MAG TPA: LPS assembly lipoprotein LptE [Pseudolabrys sp.]|nr:LPS assembly lipoprotein LptE [Pseudolabrys sp.]
MTGENSRRVIRLLAVVALAGLTAGCFEPLYGTRSSVGGEGVGPKLAAVNVAPIDTPNGTRLARLGVDVRNDLIFGLTGGSGGAAPTHRLDIRLAARQLQVIVDVNTARPDVQNYGIDATYTLTDLSTGKKVVEGQTFSRVSYDIPGQQQRFAGARGLRDAEDRAAQVIADNIRTRLASYFVAGS